MKLLRYGRAGFEKPGVLDDQGQIRDLSATIGDLTAEHLLPDRLRQIQGTAIDRLPVVSANPRLGTPYLGIGKFIAVGLNYSDHAAESGLPVPSEPVIFTKATSCIVGPDDDIMLPKGFRQDGLGSRVGRGHRNDRPICLRGSRSRSCGRLLRRA